MNNLAYAQVYQTELDKQMIAQASSGWMEVNSGLVKYNGGKEVKLPSVLMNGLANYDRDNGFTKGGISLTWDTYTLTQDRGRTFNIDAMDNDEANFSLAAASLLAEFQATQVIPEVDSYRYSAIAQKGIENNRVRSNYTPTASDIFQKLFDDIYAIYQEVGDNVPLVITMSMSVAQILDTANAIDKQLDVGNFKKGDVDVTVKTLNNHPIIRVPDSRMKTAYVFKDGVSAGEEAGGYEVDPGAKDINWIITAKNVPIAISKTDTVRIFQPHQNVLADAWKLDYRKYHDLWIPKNKLKGIFVNIKQAL